MGKDQSFLYKLLAKFGFAKEIKRQIFIHKSTGIPLLFKMDENTFPDEWLNKEVRPKVELIKRKEISRSSFITSKAMDKYPKDFLVEELKAVYVFQKMFFRGQPYAGTHDEARIYMCNAGVDMGFSDNLVETIFHHEMASILLQKYPMHFNSKKWNALNKQDYWATSSSEILNRKTNTKTFNDQLSQKGFINEFASSTVRNDFVTIAENLFLNDSYFHNWVENYPILQMKCKLVIQFYYVAHLDFTPKYFQEIG